MKSALVFLLLAAPLPCRALSWWPDKLASAWTGSAVPLDGKDENWYKAGELDESQVVVRAFNDSSRLYLRLVALGLDGRALLSGAYRQDMTLWFMDASGKKPAWGIRFPYSGLGPASYRTFLKKDDFPDLPALTPELAAPQGLAVSTAALPADIALKYGLSGKNPYFDIVVPLDRVALQKGAVLAFRLASPPVEPAVRKRFSGAVGVQAGEKPLSWDDKSGKSGTESKSVRFGEHRAERRERPPRSGDEEAEEPVFPDALTLDVTIRLAGAP